MQLTIRSEFLRLLSAIGTVCCTINHNLLNHRRLRQIAAFLDYWTCCQLVIFGIRLTLLMLFSSPCAISFSNGAFTFKMLVLRLLRLREELRQGSRQYLTHWQGPKFFLTSLKGLAHQLLVYPMFTRGEKTVDLSSVTAGCLSEKKPEHWFKNSICCHCSEKKCYGM